MKTKTSVFIVVALIALSIFTVIEASSIFERKEITPLFFEMITAPPDLDIDEPKEEEKEIQFVTNEIKEVQEGPEKIQTIAPYDPARLIIPTIKLDSKIEGLGVTPEGKMDVPDAKNIVGWYKYGTTPGEVGSAVMDAHVFNAFKELEKLNIGDDIFVIMGDQRKIHFKVTSRMIYSYTHSSFEIFSKNDTARLNLITCHGSWMPEKNNYSHRLIIFAELVT